MLKQSSGRVQVYLVHSVNDRFYRIIFPTAVGHSATVAGVSVKGLTAKY